MARRTGAGGEPRQRGDARTGVANLVHGTGAVGARSVATFRDGRGNAFPGFARPAVRSGAWGEHVVNSAGRVVPAGLAMIAVTYGLARFAYGLFLPELRESLDLSELVLGLIGAGSYAGYCLAVLGALVFTARAGPRLMALAAGSVAVVGMAIVAGAPTGLVLALGVLVAGSSSGLASAPMG